MWGREFPFYYVQIAPFNYGSQDPTVLAQFWEAQAAAQQAIPKSGMVVINDIATLNDIHPPNKQDVGQRLAGIGTGGQLCRLVAGVSAVHCASD
mgnify:CR=1 FL=1